MTLSVVKMPKRKKRRGQNGKDVTSKYDLMNRNTEKDLFLNSEI